MTVTETLEFAYRCSVAAPDSKSISELRTTFSPEHREEFDKYRRMGERIVELYLRLLMIYKCKDTIIGTQDGLLKGCSGGERRRVTLGEMLVTGGTMWLCDEISTGLDSNSTKEICVYLKSVAQIFQTTCVVALLQPAPDVVELFKDVILLSEGSIIYHGPVGGPGCEAVKGYFEDIGFVCPDQKDIGDFLQDVATCSGLKLLAQHKRAAAPNEATATNQQVAAWLAELWTKSELYKSQAEHVHKYNCKQEVPPARYLASLENKILPTWWESMQLVMKRSWSVRMRNVPVIIGRVIQNIFMGLIFGSLFFQVKDDQWYLKAMLFAQMLGFMQSSTIGQINPMCADRCIFYKHHREGFYTGTQFALAEWISAFPFTMFDGLIFGNILYWMCGMVYEFEAWALYMCIAILYGVVMNMQISVFVYVMPTQSGAFTLAVLFVLLWMVFAGSIATPDVIPSWLKWLYYINPQAWAYQALAINEFRCAKYDGTALPGGEFECEIAAGVSVPGRCGTYYLKARQFQSTDDYLWNAFAVMGGWCLLCFALTCYALNNIEHDPPKSAHADEEQEHDTLGDSSEEFKTPFLEERRLTVQGGGLSLACDPTTLFFHKMTYSVMNKDDLDKPYAIVNEITGIARPGRMVALMGASGAGKTTLLDVLAGRKNTGTITGDIAINGQICAPTEFAQLVGYVEQFGVHATTATVFEALVFSAMLRNKSDQRLNFVAEIARMLELDLIADKLVLHCSIEENKRLTIGVEAVANPAVMFLDEPTSGLDARSAMIVMRGMERIARTGRTVLATIHQPNIDIFRMFDGLLLLGKRSTGGFTAFFSEDIHSSADNRDCKTIIDYFWSPQHRKYTHKLPANYNTATWMLEVIENSGTDGKIQDWPGHWMADDNELFQQANTAVEQLLESAAEDGELPEPYTAPTKVQFSALIGRCFTQYWRSPDFSFSRFFVIFFVSAIVALIYEQQEYHQAADVQSRVSVIAFAVMLGGIYNLYTVIPFATENRAVFYRERASGMYTNTAYVFSSWVEIPYLIVETALGVNTMYWLIGFQADMSVWFYYNIVYFLYITAMTYMGMVLSALMPDVVGSQIVAALFINVCALFAGSLVPEPNIPSYYKFLYWISPQKWAQEGVIATQFHGDSTYVCNPLGVPCKGDPYPCNLGTCTVDGMSPAITGSLTTAGEYVLKDFVSGYKYDMRNWDLFVLAAWVVAARVLLGVIIHKVNHLKR
eukprot:TRINITY_DN15787_c0_g1_i2.p1 TRINITY_DN15787_c0_g1~~TRINITY_DN15787_c0_g1_i2.p1  ORF type:complete len:1225 (-),score=456.96 TRINITY_DN15787_c0_g1_i2:126-3800(-)